VLDDAGSHSWLHRARQPDKAELRLFLMHPDADFLALVRGAARVGTIGARPGGSW